MSRNRVTMREVAKAAGVHQSTVSLALRNDQRLPKETRERVARCAKDLGYRPHPLLSVLGAARRSGRLAEVKATLAFVQRADHPREMRRLHYIGACEAAGELGYRMETFIIGKEGLSPSRLNRVLLARNIPGVLIAPLPQAHGSFDLQWEELCAVAIEYTFRDPPLDRVVHDSYASMRLVLRKCREQALRRAGLVFSQVGHERTEGLNEAAYRMEQNADRFFSAIPPLYIPNWEEALFLKWFHRYRPDVVITSAVFFTLIAKLASRNRWRVPEEFALVNIHAGSGESGIGQNTEVLGATAARLLIDKIIRNDRGIPRYPQTILIPGQWQEGRTLLKKEGITLTRGSRP